MNNDISALIPIKGHSERVPNKNFNNLGSKPLYQHILDTLLKIKYIKKIYIDTDVTEKIDRGKYNNLNIIERPKKLRGDMVSVNSLIKYDLDFIDTDIIFQTHVTNPFLSKGTIEKCIKFFMEKKLDSIFSVNMHHKRFWSADKKPVNHDPNQLIRSQDLTPLYEDNSCIYLFTKDFFYKYNMRMNEHSKMFVTNFFDSFDIDTKYDWRIAECLIKQSL